MKQIVLEKPRCLVASDAVPPLAGPGEALLRVHRVGVCGTDFHAFHGRQPFFTYPRVIGHELGAEVVEAPANDRGLAAGDHCTVEPYLNCGKCAPCRSGHYNNCEDIRVLGVHSDGGLREFLAAPLDHIYKSSRLSFDQLALVEPLSIGAQAVMRSGLGPGEQALVVGAGPIGVAIIDRVSTRDWPGSRGGGRPDPGSRTGLAGLPAQSAASGQYAGPRPVKAPG